jgi:hypothetical protein
MTSQQLGDLALAEHREVMAALLRSCIQRPTDEQYDDQLSLLREEMGKCVIFISDLPSHVSGAL